MGTKEHDMVKIRFYDNQELEGLNDQELQHLQLVSRVLAIDDLANATELEALTDQELLHILQDDEVEEPRPIRKRKPSKPCKPEKPVTVKPRTMSEAFAIVEGRLMRRTVAMVQTVDCDGKRWKEVEHFISCGARVRFGGRTYYSSIVMHYLATNELVSRTPKLTTKPRHRARLRHNGKLVHLGYFASVEDRNAVIFAYKIGIFNPMGANKL
jgi:hypothetical protein